MSKLLLYKGDNGIQDFWESARSEITIFKNHGSKIWVALNKVGGIILQEEDLNTVIERLISEHGINAILNEAKHWVKDEGKENMVLQWAYVL